MGIPAQTWLDTAQSSASLAWLCLSWNGLNVQQIAVNESLSSPLIRSATFISSSGLESLDPIDESSSSLSYAYYWPEPKIIYAELEVGLWGNWAGPGLSLKLAWLVDTWQPSQRVPTYPFNNMMSHIGQHFFIFCFLMSTTTPGTNI